jgi:hypothetical protein
LKTLIRKLAKENNWDWEVELLLSPDAELKRSDAVVASSDSVVLDECKRWVNLAAEIIQRKIKNPRIIDMSLPDNS